MSNIQVFVDIKKKYIMDSASIVYPFIWNYMCVYI